MTQPIRRLLCLAAAGYLLASCTLYQPAIPAGQHCATTTFTVDDDFAGARRGACSVGGKSRVKLDIQREDELVTNPSPWYAFRLTPSVPTTAEVLLDYDTWKHRYIPKTSFDGQTWTPLSADNVSVSGNERQATLRIQLSDRPVWVSAQELITPDIYDAWNRRVADGGAAELSVLGHSRDGRPISVLRTPGERDEVLLLLGRQHPPEVSGAFGFFAFAETVFADTDLAREFRERYSVVAVPLLNPDGVVDGHWRHNTGQKDLNRDWGVFSQPETELVGALLDDLEQDGRELRFFLDFHSTSRNLFYTFPDDATNPPAFFVEWFARVRPRLDDYPFSNENAASVNQTVSKNYINERYGIAAATYEVGDETDRDVARQAAVVFAEEYMKLLLEQ